MQNQGFQPAQVVTERLVSGVEPCRTPPGKQATRNVSKSCAGFACVAATSSARVQDIRCLNNFRAQTTATAVFIYLNHTCRRGARPKAPTSF